MIVCSGNVRGLLGKRGKESTTSHLLSIGQEEGKKKDIYARQMEHEDTKERVSGIEKEEKTREFEYK